MRPHRLTYLLFCLFVFSSGCVTTDQMVTSTPIVWSGIVEIDQDMVFPSGTELIIMPGTEIVFLPVDPARDTFRGHPNFTGYELIIYGRIYALGTAENPIIFRAAEAGAAAGSWGGINLVESPGARFEYCIFRQADSAIHSQMSDVAVEQSIFEQNLVGVRFHDSQILIENNLFQQNRTAVRFHFGSPVICMNVFRNNERGIFISSYPREYHIENNSFLQNRRGNVILGEEVPDDVQMPRNFWGTTDSAAIADSFYDGQRDDYIGTVRFEPYRTEPYVGSGVTWSR